MTQRKQRIPGASPLTLTHPNAAGIDIGSASHFVAVPPDRDDEPVREFRSFTANLGALADWLEACGIDTVAMESTGVYWIALFELLDARGFTVLLVNARHVKNVTGRKSDVLDCQWLQQLMSYGLLRGAFRPDDAVCALRALVRQRSTILRTQSRSVQHMQKALVQMNIQLATVIADVAGASGQAILCAIVAGERDGHTLAALCDVRVKASADVIAASLQGHWRAEHLFSLKQALDAFDFCGAQLAECDREIEAQLQALQACEAEPAKGKKRGRSRNAPRFDLRTRLYQMCGVDLTRIDGIDVTTALVVACSFGYIERANLAWPMRQRSRSVEEQRTDCDVGYQDGNKGRAGGPKVARTKQVEECNEQRKAEANFEKEPEPAIERPFKMRRFHVRCVRAQRLLSGVPKARPLEGRVERHSRCGKRCFSVTCFMSSRSLNIETGL